MTVQIATPCPPIHRSAATSEIPVDRLHEGWAIAGVDPPVLRSSWAVLGQIKDGIILTC